MKTSSARIVAILACPILLAGCGRTTLKIDPVAVSGCFPARPQAIKLSWDVEGRKHDTLFVQIGKAGQEQRRLWFNTTAPMGSLSTERWGVDGMTFFLVDSHGKELARRTVEAVPCDRAKGGKASADPIHGSSRGLPPHGAESVLGTIGNLPAWRSPRAGSKPGTTT